MRHGQLTADDILFGQVNPEAMGLSEMGSPGDGWWRPDATDAYRLPPRRRSSDGYAQPDWLAAEKQAYEVDLDDGDPE